MSSQKYAYLDLISNRALLRQANLVISGEQTSEHEQLLAKFDALLDLAMAISKERTRFIETSVDFNQAKIHDLVFGEAGLVNMVAEDILETSRCTSMLASKDQLAENYSTSNLDVFIREHFNTRVRQLVHPKIITYLYKFTLVQIDEN